MFGFSSHNRHNVFSTFITGNFFGFISSNHLHIFTHLWTYLIHGGQEINLCICFFCGINLIHCHGIIIYYHDMAFLFRAQSERFKVIFCYFCLGFKLLKHFIPYLFGHTLQHTLRRTACFYNRLPIKITIYNRCKKKIKQQHKYYPPHLFLF